MKKIIMIVMVLSLIFLLCSCNESANDKLKVVTTIFPEYDFVREIAGDKADITMLLPIGADLHSFEPSPKDIMKINSCDVFVYVGGESDVWVENILKNSDNKNIKTVRLMDVVAESEKNHNHSHEYDEHVWTTPINAIKIVEAISKEIQLSDEENAEFYETNTADYIKVLRGADLDFKKVVSDAKRNIMVFADRYPLKHFSDEYGLLYVSPFSGCNDKTEPSAQSVKEIIDTVNEKNIPVVFYTELSNEKMADAVCEATGAKKVRFNTYHNVTKSEFENGVTYVDLMKHNLYALKEALD